MSRAKIFLFKEAYKMLSQLLFDIDPSLFLPHSCLPDIEHWKNMLPVKSDKEAMLGAGHQIRKTSCGKKWNMLESRNVQIPC